MLKSKERKISSNIWYGYGRCHHDLWRRARITFRCYAAANAAATIVATTPTYCTVDGVRPFSARKAISQCQLRTMIALIEKKGTLVDPVLRNRMVST